MGCRIAVDAGGTFTDIALVTKGRIKVSKIPSIPENPALAVMSGIKKIIEENNIFPGYISYLIHGTTVATNALLELKGARTALLTTRGFRDVLEIARQVRPALYNFFKDKPTPIVPRELRFEVPERIFYTGEVREKLQIKALKNIVNQLKKEKVESVAICFIHSYRNPVHEKMAEKVLKSDIPEIFVSCSSDVLPEFREYERMSTVCINAYVMPAIKKYLEDLKNRLEEKKIKAPLFIMQSNGGIITSTLAREQSARTVLSGPAGGVTAGIFLANTINKSNLITMDMGGTSLDVSLIYQASPRFSTESSVGGYPLKLPMIEIHTIGAGGGSIARLDQGGALKVGPDSAGAYPGPVCYGTGGFNPTVTDANLVLGRLDPAYFLGGKMEVDLERARSVIREKLARPLGITIEEAAEGIVKVTNANMVRGIRVVSVERGYDPREFILVAFGGAGPLHAVELARELAMREVIVPLTPGINSALGMLVADVRRDYVLTRIIGESDLTPEKLEKLYEELAGESLSELKQEGFDRHVISFIRSADLRYSHQAYEINVPFPSGTLKKIDLEEAVTKFHSIHRQLYGYSREDEKIELVNLRFSAIGKMEPLKIEREETGAIDSSEAIISSRRVYFGGEYIETPVYNRNLLKPGNELPGPAIVQQLDSTTVIFPGGRAKIDPYRNLIISS